MDKKSYKYRFIKKHSPKLEKNKTLEHHYSKIICSILDKNKEKKKEEKKIIDKEKNEKNEKDINFNLDYSKKLMPFRTNNKYRNLFLVSSLSFVNNSKNSESFLNKKEDINKKNKKSLNANYIKSNVTKNKSLNKENKKNLDNHFYNSKKPNITYDISIKNKIKKEKKNQLYNSKNKTATKNNKIQLFYLSNMNNNLNNLNNFNSFNLSSYTDIKKNHFKQFYISSGLNNSESFTNKIIYKRANKNNKSKSKDSKTPINNFRYNNKIPYKENNITITNYKKNINFSEIINKKPKNKKSKIIPKNLFCKKNNITKDKKNIINIKEKIKKLDLSSISLNNSSSSGVIDSKRLRSFSRKRYEKKMMNIRENELYTERTNKKIDSLYEIIKENKNDAREKPSLKIKLIDKIRRDKKLNSLFIKTE